ncbi:hypothetical protein OZ664_10120 [Elizabethkingia sp. HX WHF]|uniref:COG1470 family protein n=1 Tax=Elizabethkingia TaxID=308865 RepID=UPI000999F5B8|nr:MULTISPECIES: hypothetical protein [Elizabethkingia]ATL43315.1 hypothetical protein CQS02_08375 [Elizabethkingia miricola]MCL1638614.1 hypothetical protein [Elizabethkingia bruuniana]MDX8564355.1 hypothetical protein [Elizabethkingia sp. HX WHF]OPC26157.1 hypothetical protein BAY00_02285 [Elizabethkingia bruuniana]
MIKNLILYLIILFPALIYSQLQPQQSISKKDSLVPGTATSVSFIIENNTTEDKVYSLQVSTSTQLITPIITKTELKIPAREKALYIVPIRIATEASQGSYHIFLQGIEKNPENKFTQSVEVNISSTRSLSLTVLNTPEFVRAGEPITASFLLKNNGNTTEALKLESSPSSSIDKESSFSLAPGENKVISITQNTDPELGRNDYQNLSLSAQASGYSKEKLTAYTSVRIIAVKPIEEDIYYRFPISASVSFIGMRNRGIYENGFQGELYGKGSLSKEHKDMLEFRAVSPNPVEFSAFTKYEEYFVNYKSQNLFVHLGDKTFSSSFLTEYARYGRGAELRYDFKKVSLGGFYNHPRFFRDIKDEFNLYSTFRLGKGNEITAGYLYKKPQADNHNDYLSSTYLDSNAHLPYLITKLKPFKNIEVQAEAAYSETHKTNGTAYMLQAQAYYEKVNGNILYMKSNPQFAGYFNNTNSINANIQYRITKRLNVFANYMQDAKNFQRDTLLLAAPYRKFFQYGINFKYMKSGNIAFNNGFQTYEDRLKTQQFNYNEKFFKVSINQKIGIFNLNMEGQFGKTDNYLTGFTGNSNFYMANVSFDKFKTTFNLFGSYGTTSRYQEKDQKQIYYGARVSSRLSQYNSLSIFYQNNYIPEEYYKDRNLFELLFHQRIARNHEFDISGRYALQRGELGDKDFIFSLRYTMRMNLPVQKIAEYTSLTGNISNMGVKKTDGIRLLLGNQLSVTDINGNFTFKNVVPGDYYLEIDRSTTEMNDISNINLPVQISLVNKQNVFNFGLTGAANIKGHIRLSEQGNTDQPEATLSQYSQEKNKKESIVIEVSNGEQTYRKICSINEDFDFTYLRPGEWTVKLYRNGMDKRYKIATDNFKFILKAYESKSIDIYIVKHQAEVKFQQEAIKVEYNERKKTK